CNVLEWLILRLQSNNLNKTNIVLCIKNYINNKLYRIVGVGKNGQHIFLMFDSKRHLIYDIFWRGNPLSFFPREVTYINLPTPSKSNVSPGIRCLKPVDMHIIPMF
ncbi:hypothetical protein KJA15_00215, partial [Patescibacteria group bacterium]|nr:hypothetical protein [Patescibacteria group bacterium]